LALGSVDHLFSISLPPMRGDSRRIVGRLGLTIKSHVGLSECLNADWFSEAPELLPVAELVRRLAAGGCKRPIARDGALRRKRNRRARRSEQQCSIAVHRSVPRPNPQEDDQVPFAHSTRLSILVQQDERAGS